MRRSLISAFVGLAAVMALSAPALAYEGHGWHGDWHHEHEWHDHEGHWGWYRPRPVVRYAPPVAYYYQPVYYPAPAYSVTTFRIF